ncbi:MAG: hypothetical protein AUK47_17660 [Deltaproteobacteria bacterium CG2_30_63_29]|nr:MAG: hypothetical protein AUK47_17660 [Deltaproteobacteria bacterium CG2_30_63_29]
MLIQPSAMERIAGTTEPISEPSAVASRPRFHLGLGIVHFPGVCTLVGSRGRASVAQGCTLGWGMFGPRGADASGYALGGFDLARSMAVELWAAFNAGLPRVVEVNSTIAPSPWASALKGPLKNSPTWNVG